MNHVEHKVLMESKCPRCHAGRIFYDRVNNSISCDLCDETWVPL